MTPEQARFVAFHHQWPEIAWQWIFRGGTLVARAGSAVATITAHGLADLVDAGVVEPIGSAGIRLREAA